MKNVTAEEIIIIEKCNIELLYTNTTKTQ